MESILANAIELFIRYQVAKLTNENIDIQEFVYSEQQKRADFVDERNLPNNEKIDIESILEDLATVQKTTSEYKQRPWERDIVLRVQRMGAFTTSASTHLYKSRVKLKELPVNHRRNQSVHRNTNVKSRQENRSECDHVFHKELYGNRVMKKYTKRKQSTLYGEEKEGRVQVNIRYSGVRHNRGISASQDNDEAGRKRG
jgi:hypothetical protein